MRKQENLEIGHYALATQEKPQLNPSLCDVKTSTLLYFLFCMLGKF